ncbi:(2R,3R)-2,3-butanediol dehydrogenase [Gonapodya sp. JEL0774]|nr:(2R,3R)-2,3-butanediol dehydrogenase [Gonapodya sp. JEL0774]
MDRLSSLLTTASESTGLSKPVIALGLGSILAGALYSFGAKSKKIHSGKGLTALVTGCDTGFGPMIAIQLSQKGFTVYAGCLTNDGISRLNALGIPNLKPVLMDVTRDDHVKAVRERVEKESPEGLYCLVNNAGVVSAYKWELSPLDAVRRDVEVNYLGVVRVCKEFLPLLRVFSRRVQTGAVNSPKPRIVTISSAAGTQRSTPLGSYMASKHALQAFSGTLRQEIKRQGILYSSIEPFVCETPIVTENASSQKKIDYIVGSNSKEVLDVYGGEKEIRRRMALNGIHTRVTSMLPPQMVVTEVLEQTQLYVPGFHVPVGFGAKLLIFMTNYLPAWFMDDLALSNEDAA